MATGPSQSSRIADFKQGQYSDGHPLDEVQYRGYDFVVMDERENGIARVPIMLRPN